MKNLRALILIWIAGLLAVAQGATVASLEPVALSPSEGRVVAAAFSPDNRTVAFVRCSRAKNSTSLRLTVQTMNLLSGAESLRGELAYHDSPSLEFGQHFLVYSADGKRLLFAVEGSDELSVIDAASLRTVKQLSIQPRTSSSSATSAFKGVFSLTASAASDRFAILRHDESADDEVIIGSFASAEIVERWSLGRMRVATSLGETSLSLSSDGRQVAISMLPDRAKLPVAFKNVRVYEANSGTIIQSIRTGGLTGQIVLLNDNSLLAARIDAPGLLSRSNCVERWSLPSATLTRRFCDAPRNAFAVDAALSTGRVASYAGQVGKDNEGHFVIKNGRISLWDTESGTLLASLGRFNGSGNIKISPDGRWIYAGSILLAVPQH